MFHTDSQLMEVTGLRYGEVVKNYMFRQIPYKCKVAQPDALVQHNGMTNSVTEICMRK